MPDRYSAAAGAPTPGMTGLLATATGLAALVVGVLYSVGAVLVAGQLRPTDLPLRDVLPVIPLPQLLARGMAAVLGSLGVLVAVVVWLGAGLWYGILIDRRRDALASDLDAMRTDVLNTTDELRDEIVAMEPDDTTTAEELEVERARLLKDVEAGRNTLLERIGRLTDQLHGRVEGRRFTRARVAALIVLVLISIAISDPAGVAFFVAAQLALLLPVFGLLRPRHAIVGFIVLLWASWLVSAFYYPQRLPDLKLDTAQGRVEGKLLAHSGDAVYVAARHARMRVIPLAQVRNEVVHGAPRRRPPIIALTIWHALF